MTTHLMQLPTESGGRGPASGIARCRTCGAQARFDFGPKGPVYYALAEPCSGAEQNLAEVAQAIARFA
jgi:hypothetical protein